MRKLWRFIKRHQFWAVMFLVFLVVILLPTPDRLCCLVGMLMGVVIIIKIICNLFSLARRG